jgi:ankyrin repeat protein
METSISPPGTSKVALRRHSPGNSLKDLCLASKQGSIAEVESALALLKKSGGNIDGRNAFGLSALHLATWRNHLPIVRRLLDAGADPDTRVCTVPFSELISPLLKSIFSYPDPDAGADPEQAGVHRAALF